MKMKKQLKSNSFTWIWLLIIAMLFSNVMAVSTEAASVPAEVKTTAEETVMTAASAGVTRQEEQDLQSGWRDAYIEYLNNFSPDGYEGEDLWEWYRFSLIDIDSNGIPEMFLITDAQWIPSYIVFYDGEQVRGFGRRYGTISYIPGQNRIRIEWFVKGRQGDEIYEFDESGLKQIEEGFFTGFGDFDYPLEEFEYYWNKDHVPGINYEDTMVQVTEEEYKELLSGVFDESQAVYIYGDYGTKEELIDALGGGTKEIELNERYAPYHMVAIRSHASGCYITCDIGARKSNGKYEYYDEPGLRINESQVGWYEMFYLVPCTDGSYALQSDANRQYLTEKDLTPIGQPKKPNGFLGIAGGYEEQDILSIMTVRSDFIGENNKLILNPESRFTTIQFACSGKWITSEEDTLSLTSDNSKAELFEVVHLDDNAYDAEEKAILTSPEWFNIDGKGVGYWDIQDDIGKAEVNALKKLGYTIMKRRWESREVVKFYNMESAVGVKLKSDGTYDVIVTFQGTGGDVYGKADAFFDVGHSLDGNSFATDGMHKGYTEMVDLFMDLEGLIAASVGGKEITYRELLRKAKDGQAHFTLLGHSMGGAMAQIYALKLVERGISSSQISGRTFNSALAIIPRDDWTQFGDWVNICVTSDSVTNGLVIGSLAHYGIYRLGKTIWLYDDEPDKNTEDKHGIGNIVEPKHNMNQKLLEILETYSREAGNYHIIDFPGKHVTITDNAPVYSGPGKDYQKMDNIPDQCTLMVTGATINEYGNLWLRIEGYISSNGSQYFFPENYFIYSGNAAQVN